LIEWNSPQSFPFVSFLLLLTAIVGVLATMASYRMATALLVVSLVATVVLHDACVNADVPAAERTITVCNTQPLGLAIDGN
jgi:hypothetical protein